MHNNKLLVLKTQLAEFLGVDAEDINNEDSFVEDLHMHAQELSDFISSLSTHGFEVENIDLTSLETLSDLIEALEIED